MAFFTPKTSDIRPFAPPILAQDGKEAHLPPPQRVGPSSATGWSHGEVAGYVRSSMMMTTCRLEPSSDIGWFSRNIIPPFKLRSENNFRPCSDRVGLQPLLAAHRRARHPVPAENLLQHRRRSSWSPGRRGEHRHRRPSRSPRCGYVAPQHARETGSPRRAGGGGCLAGGD